MTCRSNDSGKRAMGWEKVRETSARTSLQKAQSWSPAGGTVSTLSALMSPWLRRMVGTSTSRTSRNEAFVLAGRFEDWLSTVRIGSHLDDDELPDGPLVFAGTAQAPEPHLKLQLFSYR